MSNKRALTSAATLAAAAMVFGAAALAQTPISSSAALAQATTTTGAVSATVTQGATGTVSGGTATVSGTGTAATTTAVATGTTTTGTATTVATGTATTATAVVTGTQPAVVPTIAVSPTLYQAGGTGNFPFANPAFQRVWNRTDGPVRDGRVSRTFYWGPGPNSIGLSEQYNEAPSGSRQRLVQYFDKSRMELNNPNADASQPFFVTNGLLTVELISGFIQVGETEFTQYRPACIPMSGDFGDRLAPTYFAFQKVSNTQAGNNPSTSRIGQVVTATIDFNGTVGSDPAKANITGTNIVRFENTHNIPSVFWNFLNSSGPVYSGTLTTTVNEQLSTPWFFASGLPISEAYWARATIQGRPTDVLIQAYERRALTYVPTNPAGFQVEVANIGQHYFDWRYRNAGVCPGGPVVGTPTPPVPAGTPQAGTPVATGTVRATGTPQAGTPQATGTAQATGTVSIGTPGAVGTMTMTATAAAGGTSTVGGATTTVTAGATSTTTGGATTTATPTR